MAAHAGRYREIITIRGLIDGGTDPLSGLPIREWGTVHANVPAEVLMPRQTWADPEAYDRTAAELAEMFRKNFEKFSGEVSEAVRKAGP